MLSITYKKVEFENFIEHRGKLCFFLHFNHKLEQTPITSKTIKSSCETTVFVMHGNSPRNWPLMGNYADQLHRHTSSYMPFYKRDESISRIPFEQRCRVDNLRVWLVLDSTACGHHRSVHFYPGPMALGNSIFYTVPNIRPHYCFCRVLSNRPNRCARCVDTRLVLCDNRCESMRLVDTVFPVDRVNWKEIVVF